MGVRTWEPVEDEAPPPPRGPSVWAAAAVAFPILCGLLLGGRPPVPSQTQVAERRALALSEGRLGSEEPVRLVPSLLAAPAFAALRSLVDLDDVGLAFAGKLAASTCVASAAGVLFLAVAWRRP